MGEGRLIVGHAQDEADNPIGHTQGKAFADNGPEGLQDLFQEEDLIDYMYPDEEMDTVA